MTCLRCFISSLFVYINVLLYYAEQLLFNFHGTQTSMLVIYINKLYKYRCVTRNIFTSFYLLLFYAEIT